MSKTVTLRLDDQVYQMFKNLAKDDNRSLSNFIETAALNFVEEHDIIDEFEMEEIRNNTILNKSIQNGLSDAESGQGRFV